MYFNVFICIFLRKCMYLLKYNLNILSRRKITLPIMLISYFLNCILKFDSNIRYWIWTYRSIIIPYSCHLMRNYHLKFKNSPSSIYLIIDLSFIRSNDQIALYCTCNQPSLENQNLIYLRFRVCWFNNNV